jgi:O-antigen/teichoic acid export membrane protein
MVADSTQKTLIGRRVLLSTLSNYAAKVFTLAVWFFLTPFLVHQLGDSAYGLWILVGSVAAYGSLLDFGIAPAVTKYVAEYHARGQLQLASSLVATALWLYTALGLLAVALSVILAFFFPRLFAIAPDQYSLATWLVLLSGLGLGVALPGATSSAVLRGLQRFDLNNVISVVGMALFTTATVVVLLLGGGLLGMVAVNIPITLIMQIPTIWLIQRIAPELRFGWRGASRQLVRTVMSFSSALFAINLAGQIQTKTDEVVIGAALPVANVTPYSIARRLSEIPQVLTDQFLKVLLPLASQLHAKDDRDRLRSLYLTSTRLTLALDVPLVCGLIVLSRPFLTRWVGVEYASSTYLVTILAVASLLNTSMWPAGSILQGMGRHWPMALSAILTGLANLALSIWLVHPLGLAGVALGTLIPTTIECFFVVTPYAMRHNGVTLRGLIREILVPSLLPAIPMVAVLYILRELLHPNSYLAIGAIGVAAVAVYGLLYLALIRGKPEQALVGRLARETLRTIRKLVGPAGDDTGVAK